MESDPASATEKAPQSLDSEGTELFKQMEAEFTQEKNKREMVSGVAAIFAVLFVIGFGILVLTTIYQAESKRLEIVANYQSGRLDQAPRSVFFDHWLSIGVGVGMLFFLAVPIVQAYRTRQQSQREEQSLQQFQERMINEVARNEQEKAECARSENLEN